MIKTLKTKIDYIYAYVEWEILDRDMKLNDDGETVYVQNVWIHRDYRSLGILDYFICQMFNDKKSKNIKYVYWNTNKTNRVSKLHCISKVLKHTSIGGKDGRRQNKNKNTAGYKSATNSPGRRD
jgi:hypothetical protein